MKVLLLTEAGEGIGFGHLTRMSAISDYLKENGCETEMIVDFRGRPDRTQEYIIADWKPDFPGDLRSGYNAVLIDSYLAEAEIYRKSRSLAGKVIVIDDYNRLSYEADALINPNVYFEPGMCANQTAACNGGKNWVIFRREFRISGELPPEDGSVLVTLGGYDYHGLVKTLLPLRHHFHCRFLCPDPELLQELRQLAPDAEFLGRLNASEMIRSYSRATVVVSGCGQSLHELALLRKKVIGILVGEDQRLNRNYYSSTGFLSSDFSWDAPDLLHKVSEALSAALSAPGDSVPDMKFDPEENLKNYLSLIAA